MAFPSVATIEFRVHDHSCFSPLLAAFHTPSLYLTPHTYDILHNTLHHITSHHDRCKKEFDYSDHLVLFMTHFLVVSVIELSYVLHISNLQPFQKYSVSVISAGVIFALTCRTLLFTGMFFHTILENFMAMGIFLAMILLPLLLFTKTRLFRSMFY